MSSSNKRLSRKQVDESKTTPGQQLRRLRMEKDISVEVVAEATKISINNIHAIEESAFEKLPADTFVRGLVTLYGNFLGINGREIATEFLKERKKINPGTRRNNLATRKISSSALSPKKLAEPAHISSATVALLLLMIIVLSFTGFCLYTSWNPVAFLSRQTNNMQASIQKIFNGNEQQKTDTDAAIPLEEQKEPNKTTNKNEEILPAASLKGPQNDATQSQFPYRLTAHFIQDSGVVVTIDNQEPIRKKYSTGEVVNWSATKRLKIVFDAPEAATLILNNAPLTFPSSQNKQPPTLQLPDDLLDQ
jgi:cytoskeletal protein RodZ